MNNDTQTTAKGVQVALVGIVAQALMALATGLLAAYVQSDALQALCWMIASGLPVWLILWVYFNQQKAVQAESMQASLMARKDADAAALFEDEGSLLSELRRRVLRIERVAMPIVSVLLSGLLLGVGGWLYWKADKAISLLGDQYVLMDRLEEVRPLLVFILLVAGLAAFLMARYVAGMTRQAVWLPLRAGSSVLIGVVLCVVLIAATVAWTWLPIEGYWHEAPLRSMSLVIPGIMVLIGVEVVLSLLTGMYSPRKAGVYVRPAFDSRLLGFLARPESLSRIFAETIQYQFGVEVTRSWFYRMLSKSLLPLCCVCMLVVIACSMLFVVAPHEKAIVLFCGQKTSDEAVGPGLHIKAPWPLGSVRHIEVGRDQEVRIGSPVQNIDGDESTLPLMWNQGDDQGEVLMVTADNALIALEVVMNWRISSGYAGSYGEFDDTSERLESLLWEQTTLHVARYPVNALLGEGLTQMRDRLLAKMRADMDPSSTGVEITGLNFVRIRPASEVASAFQQSDVSRYQQMLHVIDASRQAKHSLVQVAGSLEHANSLSSAISQWQTLETMKRQAGEDPQSNAEVMQARAKVDALLDQSGGEIARIIGQARLDSVTRLQREKAAVARFKAQQAAWQACPEWFRTGKMMEAMARGMQNRPKIVVDTPQGKVPSVHLELEGGGGGASLLGQ